MRRAYNLTCFLCTRDFKQTTANSLKTPNEEHEKENCLKHRLMTKSKVDTKAKHHEEKKGKPQNQRFTDYLCVSNCTLQTFSFLTCSSKDARRGPSKVIDVTVPVQCQDMDLQPFLTESSKVRDPVSLKIYAKGHGFASDSSRKFRAMIRQSQVLTIEPCFFNFLHDLVSFDTTEKRARKIKLPSLSVIC